MTSSHDANANANRSTPSATDDDALGVCDVCQHNRASYTRGCVDYCTACLMDEAERMLEDSPTDQRRAAS